MSTVDSGKGHTSTKRIMRRIIESLFSIMPNDECKEDKGRLRSIVDACIVDLGKHFIILNANSSLGDL